MISINHSGLSIFANEHYQAIQEHYNRPRMLKKIQAINAWFLNNGSNKTFQEVITSNYTGLIQIAYDYKKTSYPSEIKSLITLYNCFSTEFLEDSSKYRASDLIKKMGIKVCPYCNRNFINNAGLGKRGVVKRTSQIDHFFNKSEYPFLAMSFYNLIPSCPSCNLIKLQEEIGISPYDQSRDIDNLLTFNYNPKQLPIIQVEDIDIILQRNNPEIEKNIVTFHLEVQYSLHNDLVFDLLKKGEVYSESRLEELRSEFPKLFPTKEEQLRILYGNYLNSDDYIKRPLAKLTRDIVMKIYQIQKF